MLHDIKYLLHYIKYLLHDIKCYIMKRSDLYGFDFAERMKSCENGFVPYPEIAQDTLESHNPSDALLRIIYAPDELSKLPTGDLTYFVSDKANPEVKQFILDNLLMDTSSAANPAAPKGMSDDEIMLLSRQSGESLHDYANRLNQSVEVAKYFADVSSRPAEPALSNE